MVSNCRASQFAYAAPVKVDDKKDKAKVRARAVCRVLWFLHRLGRYAPGCRLLLLPSAVPVLNSEPPPSLVHAPRCAPHPPAPHLRLGSLQLPTAVLSTTARAKARAAKKSKDAAKDAGAGGEAAKEAGGAGEAHRRGRRVGWWGACAASCMGAASEAGAAAAAAGKPANCRRMRPSTPAVS